MKPPRTPERMMHDINNLNCHAGDGGYGPVTVAQMEAIYAEARKIEWTEKKPDREGKWWFRNKLAQKMGKPQILTVWMSEGELLIGNWGVTVATCGGQWSTRPIDMPEEARKELSK